MNYTVSTMSLAAMLFTLLFSIILPLGLFIFFWKKKGCDTKPFFVGCIMMFVVGLVLKPMASSLLLSTGLGSVLQENIWVYAVYGGLLAALFEETGHYLAFRFFLKDNRDDNNNALMYGAGHAGLEVFYILFLGMIGNLFMAMMMNSGTMAASMEGMTAENIAQLEASMVALAETSPLLYLASIVERLAEVVLQMSLAVLVWFAVKDGKKNRWLYPAAILIHMVTDAIAVICNDLTDSVIVIIAVLWILALAVAAFAVKTYRENK